MRVAGVAIFFALAGVPAFAASCTPADTSGCPATCVTGDVTGSVPLVHAECGSGSGISYNSNYPDDTYYTVYPKSPARNSLEREIWIHGGGWNSGNSTQAMYAFTGTLQAAILAAEQTGHAIFSINYRLTTTSPWPAPQQDCWCYINYLVASDGSGVTTPGSNFGMHLFGVSAGADLALKLLLTTPTAFPGSLCSSQAAAAGTYSFGPSVFGSTPYNMATGGASSMYAMASSGGVSPNPVVTTAINNALSCSSLATCKAADDTMKMSNSFWLNDSTARVAPMMWMAAVGSSPYPNGTYPGTNGDTTVTPNENAFAANRYMLSLNPPVQVKFYTQNSPEHNLDFDPQITGLPPTGKGGLKGGAMPNALMFMRNQVGSGSTTGSNASGGAGVL